MTQQVIVSPKILVIDRSLPAMQIRRKLPDGVRTEVIYGKLYILASPNTYHAKICGHIFCELMLYLRGNEVGTAFHGPVDVFLNDEDDVVIPDILFVSNEKQQIIHKRGVYNAPDLHIEVLSPSNRKYDLVLKKSLYEQVGVNEYWIVDPETKNAQGYLLKDGKYGDPLLTNSEIYIRILNKTIRF
jgi:Uma2 family endonuclease